MLKGFFSKRNTRKAFVSQILNKSKMLLNVTETRGHGLNKKLSFISNLYINKTLPTIILGTVCNKQIL